jgi:hypothetical protein
VYVYMYMYMNRYMYMYRDHHHDHEGVELRGRGREWLRDRACSIQSTRRVVSAFLGRSMNWKDHAEVR